jgi:hypothetical protein
MKDSKLKAVIERAVSSFVQAFVGVFLAGLTVSISGVQLKALAIAAFAAGLSALKNIILTPEEAKQW